MKKLALFLASPIVVVSIIGLFYASLLFVKVADTFTPQVAVGQNVAEVVAIMGEPTDKYQAPEMVDGAYMEGATLLVYRYQIPGPSSGDTEVYFKNGKVVALSRP